ncbi:DNA-directed RNA polymerase subunit delta [Litchfieldia salsa]|uniref:Probable DNA-directed RNA polymerase subunit delta n=1 Tax=Litchfieldia salsa TaxID=930152 RepID=A0A1H0U5B0_9BACI|nr:DNA-directed RNA polymerase subunit delta [Litchfieldia salsa]SDP61467.1 DNA-directed RNA polymerase subunit delta [Litchfieldia salsa]
MGLEQYSPEELKELSMLEVAYLVFQGKSQAITFRELLDEVVSILELSKSQVNEKVAQFYTDINVDGRFMCIGEAGWGLRSWYPYDQIDEEVTTPIKPKKKKSKKKKAAADDLDVIDYDLDDEEELEYDELDDFDDDEEDDIEDDVDDVEDFEEDDLDDDDEDLVEEDEEFELDEDLDDDELDEDEEDEEL